MPCERANADRLDDRKIKPNIVLVRGKEEKHAEGGYFLKYNNQWIAVGDDASEAQRKRMLRLNQMEYARLHQLHLRKSAVRRRDQTRNLKFVLNRLAIDAALSQNGKSSSKDCSKRLEAPIAPRPQIGSFCDKV